MLTPRFIAEHWSLTDISFGETVQSYPTRRVVQIQTEQGTFVAKVDDQPLACDVASQAYGVFDFLASRSFPHIPVLLKTKDGHTLLHTPQQSVALMEYLDGAKPDASCSTWDELGAIAHTLNAFTDYPRSYAIETEGAIAALLEQANTHPHRAQFQGFVSALTPLVHAPPDGLLHGEINLSNVARRRDGTLVLLDWDDAGTGPTVLDVGYPLIVVFLSEELHFHHDLATAFYHRYYAGHAPSDDEKDLLFRAALLHALRYMPFANQQQRWERVCYTATVAVGTALTRGRWSPVLAEWFIERPVNTGHGGPLDLRPMRDAPFHDGRLVCRHNSVCDFKLDRTLVLCSSLPSTTSNRGMCGPL
jgi:Ser/Thr protein kinase RdoA (MazF antagonist)